MTGETRSFLEVVVGGRLAPSRRLAALVAELKPRELEKAAAEVERRLGDMQAGSMPAPDRLDEVAARIRATWRRTRSLSEVARRDLRMLPWVAFYPSARPDEWLGAEPEFWTRLRERLEAGPASSVIGGLVQSILMYYPRNHPTFEAACDTIQQLLRKSTSPRLHRWRERSEAFGLLRPAAHESFATVLLAEGAKVGEVLSLAGLEGLLGRSQFIQEVHCHAEGRITAQLAAGASNCSAIVRFAALCEIDGQLRFEHRRRDIATVLLRPFLSRNPAADIQQLIQALLLKHLGDVRVNDRGWLGVPTEIRAVMLRWMVRGTLDTFFEIVRLTALDRMWNERKRFWSRYMDRELVTDAWIALGPDAAQYLARLPRESVPGAARLLSGYGVLAGHSLLLMRLGNLIVAEWSHNGKCRIWRTSSSGCPQLYQPEYRRPDVVQAPDLEVVHRSGWQEEIDGWLRRETGVRVW